MIATDNVADATSCFIKLFFIEIPSLVTDLLVERDVYPVAKHTPAVSFGKWCSSEQKPQKN